MAKMGVLHIALGATLILSGGLIGRVLLAELPVHGPSTSRHSSERRVIANSSSESRPRLSS